MSIDGINRPGGPGSIPPSGGVGPADADVAETDSSAPVASAGSSALSALDKGEISVDEYLDHKVAEATSHLQGKLNAEQLQFVTETLRAELSDDPVLVELVRRTTAGAGAGVE
jgi:hypothetical protein